MINLAFAFAFFPTFQPARINIHQITCPFTTTSYHLHLTSTTTSRTSIHPTYPSQVPNINGIKTSPSSSRYVSSALNPRQLVGT
jgi:hypothetical protein